jgi:hypothetical protein
MEMSQQYLEKTTVIADFWVADKNGTIKSVENESIGIKKSNIYLNKFEISIIMKTKDYGQLDLFAEGWKDRFPKAIITKASGSVRAYDLRFLKVREKQNFTVLEFVGVISE